MPNRLRELDRLYVHAERVLATLERCQPLNAAAELSRLLEAQRRGITAIPAFRYAPPPRLDTLTGALEAAVSVAERAGPLGTLYAERARELCLEAELVGAIGTPCFAGLAARRFPVDETAEARWADQTARAWIEVAAPAAVCGPRILSDDESDPRSLVSLLQRTVGRMRLPLRVEVSSSLAAAAATGEGRIVVRSGLWHDEVEARRIIAHEIEGHALPRHNARFQSIGLLRVGTHRADADEEGRALLIEQRLGLLGSARRRQLAARHMASLAVRRGAGWADTVQLLTGNGLDGDEAVHVAARAHRGGGLAREVVYLPALRRVERAFADEPHLEGWFRHGRVSVDGARRLAAIVALRGNDLATEAR